MSAKTMKPLKVEKVTVGPRGLGNGTVALGCHYEGARYHVWLHPDTLTVHEDIISGPVVYKNPLVDDRNHPDYFNTRTLKTGSEFTVRLLESMLEVYKAKDLLAKFEAQEAKEEIERKAKIAADARLERIRSLGPELLEALEGLLAIPVCKGHLPHIDTQRARRAAQAVMAKCDGR